MINQDAPTGATEITEASGGASAAATEAPGGDALPGNPQAGVHPDTSTAPVAIPPPAAPGVLPDPTPQPPPAAAPTAPAQPTETPAETITPAQPTAPTETPAPEAAQAPATGGEPLPGDARPAGAFDQAAAAPAPVAEAAPTPAPATPSPATGAQTPATDASAAVQPTPATGGSSAPAPAPKPEKPPKPGKADIDGIDAPDKTIAPPYIRPVGAPVEARRGTERYIRAQKRMDGEFGKLADETNRVKHGHDARRLRTESAPEAILDFLKRRNPEAARVAAAAFLASFGGAQ